MPYADPELQREFQRRWVAERRAQSLEGRSCEACGATEDLEWHHLNPEEKLTHAIWSWTDERRAKELEKCIVLCDPCHDALHARRRRAEAIARNPHGTRARRELGCGCKACRDAKAAYNREHRSKPKEAA